MKITYNQNPLFTKIELNENEKKELWYKIKIKEMEEILFDAHYYLEEGKNFDIQKAQKSLSPDYYYTDEKSPLDKRCDALLESYLSELNSFHFGDCTCVPCSCIKCHAEAILGIDTLKGLGKHPAYYINDAFGENNEKTIQEAIEYLANYEPKANWDGWEKEVSRWKLEAQSAHDWLVDYKQNFLKD